MLRSHKIRLDPTVRQSVYFARACGTARFAYNWALGQWQAQYEAHKVDPELPKPSEGALRRQLNAIKREQFPWMLEVTKCAPQEAIRALGEAYKNWWNSLSGKRKGPPVKAPTFKKKDRRDSFKIHGNVVAVDGCRIRIPLLGWVRMREPLRFAGEVKSVTLSRTAQAWFVSLTVETDCTPARCKSQAAVGVDVGLSTLATLSTGESVHGPKALTALPRLQRASRALSRKVKGSANRKKAAAKLARLHWRIANVRQDALHKLTDRFTRDYAVVCTEDLNVSGMLRNGRLARHLADASFGEFQRQLTYKAQQRGVQVIEVGRFFASSKTCSACGEKNEGLTLGVRRWRCAACGREHERDINAAVNILQEGLRLKDKAPGAGVSACGARSSGRKPLANDETPRDEAGSLVSHTLAGWPGYA